MKHAGVLEVVLPYGMDEQHAENMVREHIAWIEKQQQKCASQADESTLVYPDSISFPVINQTIAVTYHQSDTNAWEAKGEHLTVHVTAEQYTHKVLKAWLKQRAKFYLPNSLAEIAEEMGETYKSVSIRLQKTRWGSCSSQRRINLNAKLLLLPKPLMRYVMVHELAHLKHLNHSPAFWQHVRQFEPDYPQHRQALHAWERATPGWLLPND